MPGLVTPNRTGVTGRPRKLQVLREPHLPHGPAPEQLDQPIVRNRLDRRENAHFSTNTRIIVSPIPTSAAPATRPAQTGSWVSIQSLWPVEAGRFR